MAVQRRRTSAILCGLLLGSGAVLSAQSPDCPADTLPAGKVCNAGVDAVTVMHPVAGLLLSGGNPVPGTAGASGKFGSFRLTARVGFAQMTLPDPSYAGASDTVPASKRLIVPAPRADLALGLFSKKLSLGTVAVDLLGSVVFLPVGVTNRVRLDPNVRQLAGIGLGFGFGFRAALMSPGAMPTVSLGVMKRNLPTLVYGNLPAGDNYSYGFNVSAINVRLIAGRKFSILSLSAGAGMDLYGGSATVSFRDPAAPATVQTPITLKLSGSRIMTLLNAGLEFPLVSLFGEAGFQIGSKSTVTTIFEKNDPSAGKFYGGLGASLRL